MPRSPQRRLDEPRRDEVDLDGPEGHAASTLARIIATVLGSGVVVGLLLLLRPHFSTARPAEAVSEVGTAATVDPPEPRESRPQDPEDRAREVLRAVSWNGTLRGPEGEPVVGAELSWTTLLLGAARGAVDVELDLADLDRRTTRAESDASGRFAFATGPPGADERPSVLWITHPDFVARAIFPREEGRLAAIELERAQPLAVLVREGGEPAAGARVLQHVARRPAHLRSESAVIEAARSALVRTALTDEDGRARLGPFGIEQRITASRADAVSAPWQGRAPATVELELERSFTASGTVRGDTGGVDLDACLVRCIRITPEGDRALRDVPLDGLRWGPVDLPWTADAVYRFYLLGGGALPTFVERGPAAPGEHVVVDLELEAGITIPVRVVASDGRPIAGAWVEVSWTDDSRADARVVRSTDREGLALLDGCRAGFLEVVAGAQGYATSEPRRFDYLAPPPVPPRVELGSACVVEGRCVHGDEPVSIFTVVYWSVDDGAQERCTVVDSEDGSFGLENVPLGDVRMFASAPGLVPARILDVRVGDAVHRGVELPLTGGVTGVGYVVDALSGLPVEGASVLVAPEWGGGSAVEPARSGSFGRYEVDLAPGRNVLTVAAAQYEKRSRVLAVEGVERVDLGLTSLHPSRPLRVRLVGMRGVDWSRWRVQVCGAYTSEPVPCDPDGVAFFRSVPAGSYILRVITPESDGIDRYVDLRLSEPWDVSIAVEVESATLVDVELQIPAGVDVSTGWTLAVTSVPDGGTKTTHYYHLEPSGRQTLRGSFGEEAVFQVFDADIRLVGLSRRRLTPGGTSRVVIALEEADRVLRVVDRARRPMRGADIRLLRPEDGSGWSAYGRTGASGEHVFSPALGDGAPLLVCVSHPAAGAAVTTLDSAVSRRVHEIVLGADPPLEVRVRDRGVPVSAVKPCLRPKGSPDFLLTLPPTDVEGRSSLGSLTPGTYAASVSSPELWPVRVLVDHPMADAVELEVRRPGHLLVEVVEEDGRAVAGAEVDLTSVDFGVSVASWIDSGELRLPAQGERTSAEGRWTLVGLPNGPYRWSVSTEDGRVASGAVTVPPERTDRLTVRLPER